MRLAISIALGLVACGSHSSVPKPAPDAEARAFGLRVIDVVERDDLSGFRDLLSARLEHRTDEGDLRRMFETWRGFLVPHAQALRDADWTLARNDDMVRYRTVGRSPEPLVRVVDERGSLRIDER